LEQKRRADHKVDENDDIAIILFKRRKRIAVDSEDDDIALERRRD